MENRDIEKFLNDNDNTGKAIAIKKIVEKFGLRKDAAEKFYDTVLREDWSMRDANKGALDILREVASWKNPQKEQENAR